MVGMDNTTDTTTESDRLIDQLEALPAHEVRTVTLQAPGWRPGTYRIMARDIPRPGRRFTNLDTGTELWFRGGGTRPDSIRWDLRCIEILPEDEG